VGDRIARMRQIAYRIWADGTISASARALVQIGGPFYARQWRTRYAYGHGGGPAGADEVHPEERRVHPARRAAYTQPGLLPSGPPGVLTVDGRPRRRRFGGVRQRQRGLFFDRAGPRRDRDGWLAMSELPEHVHRNRALWDDWARNYVAAGER